MKKTKVVLKSRYGMLDDLSILIDGRGEVSYRSALRAFRGSMCGDYYPRLIS